jgi:hypothetical protein
MTNILKLSNFWKFVVVLFVLSSGLTLHYSLSEERLLKRDKEIDRIRAKDQDFKKCMQYALVVAKEGWFSCYQGNQKQIYMYIGEIWKYGKTCLDLSDRYPDGLPDPFLVFQPQFYGSEQECLIEEKEKIYAYSSLPECLKRQIKLLRPPGNKIDR